MNQAYNSSVTNVREVAKNTFEISIKAPEDFLFTPGQYMTLTLPELAGLPTREQFRDFSIASNPKDKGVLKTIFRLSDSAFKKAIIKPGTEVELEGPGGIFTLPPDKKIIAVAGGIGVTPFLSMLGDTNVQFDLMYYNRSPESSVLIDYLRNRLGKNLHEYYGSPKLEELQEIKIKHRNINWYIAGPPGMVAQVRTLLKTLKVDDTVIRTEEFSGYETTS
jgi:ferredoxin-NADP reductase